MTGNPYESPSLIEGDSPLASPPARPVGILILAALHFLGGLGMLALGVFLVTQFGEEDRESIFSWLVVVLAPIFSALSIAVAMGLWWGQKWAWWFATFYYFQFAVGGVFVLATIPAGVLFNDRPINQRTFELALKHVVRILVLVPLCWYMMKPTVWAHFKFRRLTRLRALGILSAAMVVMIVIVGIFGAALVIGARIQRPG